jgi:hypothetical protein
MQFGKPLLSFRVESLLRDKNSSAVRFDDFGSVGESVQFVLVEGTIFHFADDQLASA